MENLKEILDLVRAAIKDQSAATRDKCPSCRGTLRVITFKEAMQTTVSTLASAASIVGAYHYFSRAARTVRGLANDEIENSSCFLLCAGCERMVTKCPHCLKVQIITKKYQSYRNYTCSVCGEKFIISTYALWPGMFD